MTAVLDPVRFEAPLVNPAPGGLFSVTSWAETATGEPTRWLPSGVEIRPHNYGGDDAFGVWAASWCAREEDLTEDDVKTGTRPEGLDPFVAMTFWASDECDLMAPTQAEVRERAAQNLRLLEPVAAERVVAARLLDDAETIDTAADIIGAVGRLESLLAATNTVGLIHASTMWAASAAQANLIVRTGGALKTPLGHTWVFGGGYDGADGLDDTLVATSPTFGWRDEVAVRTATKPEHNRFVAIAERSLLIGYEALVGAVDITG